MRKLKGIVLVNHKYDIPPEEYGVLTLRVLNDNSTKSELVDIFDSNLIFKGYNLTTGDIVDLILDDKNRINKEEVTSLELHNTTIDENSNYEDKWFLYE